jgi:hypothetical protein
VDRWSSWIPNRRRRVTKHWRQSWQYEPRELFEYADRLADGETPAQSADAVIHESLADMGVPTSPRADAQPSIPK